MLKKVIFSAAVFIVLLGLLEITARLAESHFTPPDSVEAELSGWQTAFFSSLFDWHEPDPDLLWRFKANLQNPLITTNTDHLLGSNIPDRKDRRAFRILLLGDSSPVGLGLESWRQTFGEILRSYLNLQFIDYKIELINAAVSGYTSEQVVRFMELRGWAYDPDLVLVYCGNNDASISGPLSDRELFQAQRWTALRRSLNRLALYRLMRALLTSNSEASAGDRLQLKVRVQPEEYGQNLNRLVRQAQERNCPVIVLKPPVPYLWPAGLQFKIFTHVTGSEGRLILPDEMSNILGRPLKYCLDENRFRGLYGRGDKFTRAVFASVYSDSLSPENAVKYYAALIASDAENPVLYNNLGVSYWADENYRSADSTLHRARYLYCRGFDCEGSDITRLAAGSPFLYNIGVNLLTEEITRSKTFEFRKTPAFAYLDSALQVDFFSLRIKQSYQTQIDGLVDEKDVYIIDLPRVFEENGGEGLFIDHCHPTVEGHRLIAETIYNLILEKRLVRSGL
ncbi:MAG: SGNH/GDSL hydrolase family protein [candidate division Zixibacteria bacterium]|nr:SGNH/GDSL hydrolase family protein [candidate division Zixibacteria bacterium]